MNPEPSFHPVPALRVSLLKLPGIGGRALGPDREFHISRKCRNLYHFNQAFFSLHGNVILPDFVATRLFAQRLNEKRRALNVPEKTIKPGALNAMGLIDEILHFVVGLYNEQAQPQVLKKALLALDKKMGGPGLKKVLLRFCVDFPALPVYMEQVQAEEYLLSSSQGLNNREIVLEEIMLLWLANSNPAFAPFRELFDDRALEQSTPYPALIDALQEFFQQQPVFGPDQQDLITMLRSPALAFPNSLSGQLNYMREKWGLLLGKFSGRFLALMDVIREEEKTFLPGPGPASVFSVETQIQKGDIGEKYAVDRDWMPNLVLLAKTVYVWLDQLGKKYNRVITTLDQVPDEELDMLARWGFNGLWLIGVWERSPASRRIKQKCGNPEAMASAYSLFRYEIAVELGGEKALQNLRHRAEARGMRLASDMVPNHMGIDSPWVCEHPEWFMSMEQSPFPSYTFSGENMSSDPRVAIYLEDHYYDRSDAAVVFKWVERKSGAVHYIYHGNDGTRMPWNDTAQLNYLHFKVREAVIQSILGVARQFPIIRFDAAMTLTRKHYQRLWFPLPGSGGDIPSRSGLGMSQEQFDSHMPNEFWRDVVDRMARDAPDTLLLAEAFWLMESYFVRNLGMHRVYNSAFMHFLRDEENGKFRASLKNVLEFNPEILKRFVNFMNNPDEETALAQFGNGDKYFGTCTLLATLPGLPMFGHGQVEGFSEKYGMEYRKAYRDERPSRDLIRRHEQQIFPLLKKRPLFSGTKNFLLYDFFTSEGVVDENVIAFSNRSGDERCLVVYHNCFGHAVGSLRMSAAFARGNGPGHNGRELEQMSIAQGLDLPDGPDRFVVFRDMVSQLKYIRHCRQWHAQGLAIELGSYQTHVFVDFKEMTDDVIGSLARLDAYLHGRGTDSLEQTAREMLLQPVHHALRELCRPDILARLLDAFHGNPDNKTESSMWQELEEKMVGLFSLVHAGGPDTASGKKASEALLDHLLALRTFFRTEKDNRGKGAGYVSSVLNYLGEHFAEHPDTERLFIMQLYVRSLAAAAGEKRDDDRAWFSEWMLDDVLKDILREWGFSENAVPLLWLRVRSGCGLSPQIRDFSAALLQAGESVATATGKLIKKMLLDEDVRTLLKVHHFQGEDFFNQEAFNDFSAWLNILCMWELRRHEKDAPAVFDQLAAELLNVMNFLPVLAAKAGHKLEDFLIRLDQFGVEE